jgi:hypothetical protein
VTVSLDLTEAIEARYDDPERTGHILRKTGMAALELVRLRVDSRERLHSVIRKADPFQRRGLPCELVVEIDVMGKHGMRAVLAEKDPFQWATRLEVA